MLWADQALREQRNGKRDAMECKYLDHHWMSANDIAARMASASAAAVGAKAFDSGPKETFPVDPERIKPAKVILPPEVPDAPAHPPPPQFNAWGTSQGYVFEW